MGSRAEEEVGSTRDLVPQLQRKVMDGVKGTFTLPAHPWVIARVFSDSCSAV